MKRTAVIDVVGLSRGAIGASTPRIKRFLDAGSGTVIDPAFPAVTCSAQANYLTGQPPSKHGIVGNGWYHRELAEVQFWKQSNRLVRAPKIWETLRERHPGFTCAKLFWWYNMYSSADYSITPRPMYPADGRKVFDIYTWPYSIRTDIKRDLGEFPFFGFWGPAAGRDTPQGAADCVSRWIAESAKWIERKHEPSLTLVYLPHLDYNFQRFGPADQRVTRDLGQIDAIVGDLIDFFSGRSVQVILLSEYGITPANRVVHLNRVFRERGWLAVKDELGLELLDCGASRVFAVADHQVAHVYLNDLSLAQKAREVLEAVPGVERVLEGAARETAGLGHERAGDLIAVADASSWFTYYYWMDEAKAPDFARCVDIHRKPGYDPVELFFDPNLKFLRGRIGWKLLKKKLGFRMLMDLIPLEPSLVQGSHGRRPESQADWPVMIGGPGLRLPAEPIPSTSVHDWIMQAVSDGSG